VTQHPTRPTDLAPPLELDRDHGLHLLTEMVRIRRFEERCVELYSAAKIRGFLHLYIGEEAIAAGVMAAIDDDDAIVSTYREHGHAIARGIGMGPIMAEMFGRVDGVSRGRGGSMHLFDAPTRFYGGNAIVAGGIPLAIGIALADRLQGRDRVTVCFFGEGRWTRAPSTSRSTSPRSGSCRCCSPARTTTTPWGWRSNAPRRRPTSR
jgi:pyruvate dehydrogenase E1 component alpha subunit